MKVVNLHHEEKKLIEQALNNNRHAQQKLYSQFAPKMLGVCRQYVKDLQQAEDVMITGFMKVFTNLKNFEYKGSFEGWIRRIIINECISFIRVKKEVKFMEDESFVEDSHNSIESQLSLDDIQLLIDNMPEGYKMVFNLYVIEGFKHQEIAQILGITEGTSKSQLSRAREMLQTQIQKLNNYSYGTE